MHFSLKWPAKLFEQTSISNAFRCSHDIKATKNHFQVFYFCFVNIKVFNAKQRMKIAFPNLDSAQRPVPQDASTLEPLTTEDWLVALVG